MKNLITLISLFVIFNINGQNINSLWTPSGYKVTENPTSIDMIFMKDVDICDTVDTKYGKKIFISGVSKLKNDADGKVGLIDRDGEFIVPPLYNDINLENINTGMPILASIKIKPKDILKRDTLRYGFIDREGNTVIPFYFNYAKNFTVNEELAPVGTPTEHSTWCGYIDVKGNYIGKHGYRGVWDFSEGLAKVNLRRFGYVDVKGKEIIPLVYLYGMDFLYGSTWVCKFNGGKELWGLIDNKGNELTDFIFYDVERNGYWSQAKDTTDMSRYIDALGNIYYSKFDISRKEKYILEELAEIKHNVTALRELGISYLQGVSEFPNFERALKYLKEASDLGDVESMAFTAYMLLTGKGCKENPKHAYKYACNAAEKGNMRARHLLGYMYANGLGVKTDSDKALNWFGLAEKQGCKFSTVEKSILTWKTSDSYTLKPANRINDNSYDYTIRQTNTPTENNTNNEKRIALIIGNSAYKAKGMALKNPVNDATDVAQKLQSLGFDVIPLIDGTLQQTEEAIRDFGDRAKDYDVALFYYAGHGIQSKGINYLVPIDADLVKEEDLRYKCTDANYVLDMMSGTNMKIVILDACRDNPLPRSWHRGINDTGFVSMNAPEGTFIHYSTAQDKVALDVFGDSRNSPYSAAFIETLDIPGLSILDFFQEVREKVKQLTNGRQTPWSYNSLNGRFVFNQ